MPNPWIDNLPQNEPYVLDIDIQMVNNNNNHYQHGHDYYIETSLFPEPFVGDPNAPIYILNHNPATGINPNFGLMDNQEFINVINSNISHQFDEQFPFYIINPIMENIHPNGYFWWSRRLGSLINEFGRECVARNVFNLELGPYHSRRFKFLNFPSIAYNIELLNSAIHQGKIIVWLRGNRWFEICENLENYHNLLCRINPRCAYISPRNIDNYGLLRNTLQEICLNAQH